MKLRVFVSELDRSIFSLPFFISIVGTIIAIFAGSVEYWFVSEDIVEQGLQWQYELKLLQKGVQSEAFIFFLPLLSVLPAGISVLADLRTGLIKYYLPRCGRRPYIVSKVFISVFTGGGSVVAGSLLTAWIAGAIYRPLEVVPAEDAVSMWPQMWSLCLVIFLSGAFFSLIGAILGLLFGNRYMTFGGAFMICYLMIIVSSRYMTSVYVLNPREWMTTGDYFGCAAFLGEMCVIMSLLYGQLIQKKIGKGASL